MSKRRARVAPYAARRSQPGAPRERAGGARSARRRPLLVLLLVTATIVILGLILVIAVVHGNGTPSASPTPVASTTAGAVTGAIPLDNIGVLDPASGSAKVLAAPKVSQPAPDFAWQTVNGRTSLSALRGHAVLLEFFGSWCPACQRDVQLLNGLLATYEARGLQIVSVNASPYGIDYERTGSEAPVGMSDLVAYQRTYHPNYPMVFDPTTRVFNLYGRGATFPTFFVIDAKGIVRYSTSLAISDSTLSDEVRSAL